MSDFKHQTFDIIRQLTGHENIITLNVAFIDFVGDLECGLFLSQLIYWSDRGTRKDGFIFKTDQEWFDELRLSKYAVRKSKKKLTEMGILETKIKKAYGNPTTHYKLNKEAFTQQFIWFLRNRNNESAITEEGNDENKHSLTDTLSDISSETTTDKGVEKSTRPPVAYSFKDFKNTFYKELTLAARKSEIEAIEYYLSLYQHYRGTEHPRLKVDQWDYVIENLFHAYANGTSFDLNETDMEDMMDQHFITEYRNCDYNILHFMSDGVKVRRMYEVAY